MIETEAEPQPEAPAPRRALYCGGCGGSVTAQDAQAHASAVPRDSSRLCGLCGGPAAASDPQFAAVDRAGFQRQWHLCGLCQVTARGPYADAATLADVLAGRDLAATAFTMTAQPPPLGTVRSEVGWAHFCQTLDGARPYCDAAAPGATPGVRWGHLSKETADALAAAVMHAARLREPQLSPSGRPCAECGRKDGPAELWRDPEGSRIAICGHCWTELDGKDPDPIHLTLPAPPPRGQCAQCRPPQAPEPVKSQPCGQCGGPTHHRDAQAQINDATGAPRGWRICRLCCDVNEMPNADLRVLLDVLAARRPDDASLLQRAAWLGGEPAARFAAPVDIGWRGFARRIEGLQPYYSPRSGHLPTDAPGQRWAHVSQGVIDRIVADLAEAYSLWSPEVAPEPAATAPPEEHESPTEAPQEAEPEPVHEHPAEPAAERPVACAQCAGPANVTDRPVTIMDKYTNPVTWRLCKVCESVGMADNVEAAALADVLATRLPDEPYLQELVVRLLTEPAPHPCAALDVGWAAFSRRVPGLGPYHGIYPGAKADDVPAGRWWHVPINALAQVAEDLDYAQGQRVPAAHPSGQPCVDCGRTEDLPCRWMKGSVALCGGCTETRATAPKPQPVPEPRGDAGDRPGPNG